MRIRNLYRTFVILCLLAGLAAAAPAIPPIPAAPTAPPVRPAVPPVESTGPTASIDLSPRAPAICTSRLLSAAMCVPHLPGLQWDLRALLLQADAVPDLLPLQRHLRPLLLQADALSLRPARPGVRLLHAGLFRLGPLGWSTEFSRLFSRAHVLRGRVVADEKGTSVLQAGRRCDGPKSCPSVLKY